jgi:hypothetical protein
MSDLISFAIVIAAPLFGAAFILVFTTPKGFRK